MPCCVSSKVKEHKLLVAQWLHKIFCFEITVADLRRRRKRARLAGLVSRDNIKKVATTARSSFPRDQLNHQHNAVQRKIKGCVAPLTTSAGTGEALLCLLCE